MRLKMREAKEILDYFNRRKNAVNDIPITQEPALW